MKIHLRYILPKIIKTISTANKKHQNPILKNKRNKLQRKNEEKKILYYIHPHIIISEVIVYKVSVILWKISSCFFKMMKK